MTGNWGDVSLRSHGSFTGSITPPSRPRLLFVGHDLPWPVVTGGRIRDAQLLAAAVSEWHVDAVFVAEADVVARDTSSVPPLDGLTVQVFPHEGSAAGMPQRESIPAREAIERLSARGVDAVHVEGSYLLDLLPDALLDRTVLVEHNVESDLVAQRQSLSVGGPTSADVHQAEQREERAWSAAARLVMLTDEDATTVQRRRPDLRPIVVPNGWNHVPARRAQPDADARRSDSLNLLFFANHRYEPNRDALRWLLDEVLPTVQRIVPGIQLQVAGANFDAATRGLTDRPGVTATGPYTEVAPLLDAADIVLCPLRVGGGVKVKMIEALRRGCAIVTTSIGAQGVPADLRRCLAIGDTAQRFAEQVVRLSDPTSRADARARLAATRCQVPLWSDSYRRLSSLWHEVSANDRSER